MTEEKKKVSLASLMTPSKTVTIDYPEFSGMKVDLCFLAREELMKLRNKTLKPFYKEEPYNDSNNYSNNRGWDIYIKNNGILRS